MHVVSSQYRVKSKKMTAVGSECIKYREYVKLMKYEIINKNEIIQHQEKQISLKNVIDDHFYPDDTILSLFAVIVYRKVLKTSFESALEELKQEGIDDSFIRQIQDKNEWRLYGWAENKSDDYFGAAFWNARYKQLVISHRGTVPNSSKTVLTDLEGVAQQKLTSQIHSACTFSALILEGLDRSKIRVSITGHSLGAWLGQISTFVMEYLTLQDRVFISKSCRDPQSLIHCVVLDSPGCSEILCQIAGHYYAKYEKEPIIMISALDITIYFNEPNLVNCCNSHRGINRLLQIYESTNRQENMLLLKKKTWYDLINAYKGKNYRLMLKTHSGINLVSLLSKEKEVEIKWVLNWPSFHLREAINKVTSTEPSKLKSFPKILSLVVPSITMLLWSNENELARYYEKNPAFDERQQQSGAIEIQYKVASNGGTRRNVSIFTENEKSFLKYWKQFYDRKIALEKLENIQGLIRENDFGKLEEVLPRFEFLVGTNGNEEIHCLTSEELEKTINRVKHINASPLHAFDIMKKDIHEFYEPLYQSHSDTYIKKLSDWVVEFEDTINLSSFLNWNENLLCLATHGDTKNEMYRVRNILKKLMPEVKGQCYLSLAEFQELRKHVDVKEIYKDTNCVVDSILIIDCNVEDGIDKNFITDFIETAKSNDGKKKLILIVKSGSAWLEEILQKNDIEMQEVKYLFTDFTEETRKKFLEKDIGTLWDKKVNMAEFLSSRDPKQLTDKEIEFLSQPDVLDFLLFDGPDLGELSSPHVTKYNNIKILTADIQKNIGLKWFLECLEKDRSELRDRFKKSILFMISGVSRSHFLKMLDSKNITEVILDHVEFLDDDSKEFERLCRENSSERVYWVHFSETNDDKVELRKIFDPDFYMERSMYRQDEINKTKLSQILKEEKECNGCTFIFAGIHRAKLSKVLAIENLESINWINDDCDSEGLLENVHSLVADASSKGTTENYMKSYKTYESKNIPLPNALMMSSTDLSIAVADNMDKGLNLFNEIIKENNNPVHLINAEGNGEKLSWVRSKGSLQIINNIIGTNRTTIPRENIPGLQDKTIVIVGESGTGKTTLLLKTARHLVSSWILWVSLINFRKKMDNLEAQINLDRTADFLLRSNENIEKQVIKEFLKFNLYRQTKIPIIIFFDGFDEINVDVQKTILRMIKLLEQETNATVYITAKSWAKNLLENELSVLSLKIQEIGKDQQKKFIRDFWLAGFEMNENNCNYQDLLSSKTEDLFQEFQSMSLRNPLSPLDQSNLEKSWDEFIYKHGPSCSRLIDTITIKLKHFYESGKYYENDSLYGKMIELWVLLLDKGEQYYKSEEEEAFQELMNIAWDLDKISSYSRKYLKKNYVNSRNLETSNKELAEKLIQVLKIIEEYDPPKTSAQEVNADILAIPLQLRMIGEILQRKKDFPTENEMSEYLWNNVRELYNQFTSKKFVIFANEKLQKKGVKKGREDALLERHQCLAFQTIFPNEYHKILRNKEILDLNDDIWKEAIADINKIGIVTVFDNGDITFNHISFAEYFAAEKIYRLMTETNAKYQNLEDLVMSNVLLKKENGMIRRFLDGRLESDFRTEGNLKLFSCLEKAWIKAHEVPSSEGDTRRNLGVSDVYKKIVNEKGETTLHICAFENLQYLAESVITCFKDQDLQKYLDEVNINHETAFYYTALNMNLEFSTKLLQRGTRRNLIQFPADELKDIDHVPEIQLLPEAAILIAYSKQKSKILILNNNVVSNTPHEIASLNILKHIQTSKYIKKLRNMSSASLFTLLHLGIEHDILDIKLLMNLIPEIPVEYSELLYTAARKGNKDAVNEILARGADVNAAISNSNTIVNAAAREGHWDIVLELINRDANVKIPSLKYQETVLYFAAWKGAKEVVLKALEAGADIDAVETSNNLTPVNVAAVEGHWDIVLELINRGANISIPSLKYKRTVLYYAAWKGAKEVVLKALDAGADIDAVETSDNLTSVNAAAAVGHWVIVLELISRGVNVSLPSLKYKRTVLYYGAWKGAKEVVLKALDAGADIDAVETSVNLTPVNVAAVEGHWDIVLELINRGANVSIPSLKYKRTVLYYAAWKGARQVVLKALDAGADIDGAETSNNVTPVNAAAAVGHWDVVLELILRGADVTIPSLVSKRTVLFFAALNGALEVVLRSLDAGADIDAIETDDNLTPVNAAASQEHWNVVMKLIDKGANVRIPSSIHQWTVLLFAALSGAKEAVLKLFDAGTDIDAIETSQNLTPVNAAASKGHWDIVERLVTRGANVNIPESTLQNTVLHYAAQQGNSDIVRLLLDNRAYIDPLNTNNHTPLYVSALRNHWHIVFVLISRGADIYQPGGELSILELAESAGRLDDLIKVLGRKTSSE